jgi:protein-L-isoaspartate(D-aspartate) O-methyltransferase
MTLDYVAAREKMVDCQIRTADISRASLVTAFRTVPREIFTSSAQRPLAYLDAHLPLGKGRYILAPAALARMLNALEIEPDAAVLDIGCATGYSTAVISRLCEFVVAVESEHDFAETASEKLAALEYDNAIIVKGQLAEGYPSEGPYDAIFIGGAVDELPAALLGQLKEGGRLVAVQGTGNAALAVVWINDSGNISRRNAFNCAIPPLPEFTRKAEFIF